jgi:Arginase/agmatinase/formimionoglutamate hydrolase, arginase family
MNKENKQTVTIIGFPMDLGSGRRGVDMGPSAMRIAGLENKLEQLGYKVEDTGDISIEIMERQKLDNPKLRYIDEILKTSKVLAARVEKVLEQKNFLCVLAAITQWRWEQLPEFRLTAKK